MRIKKKGLALWLALFLGVSSLSGCGGGDFCREQHSGSLHGIFTCRMQQRVLRLKHKL